MQQLCFEKQAKFQIAWINDHKNTYLKRNYGNEPFLLWSKYMIIIEIMLNTIKYFVMRGADMLVLRKLVLNVAFDCLKRVHNLIIGLVNGVIRIIALM